MVALGSHWGGFEVALGSQSPGYQHALRWPYCGFSWLCPASVEVGTPVARRPLTDPGVQYSRTGLFNLTRYLSPTGRFASLAPSFSRNWLPVWTSSGCQPLRPSRGLRLAMTYYELIRLPKLPLPLLLVVETAYPLGSRSSCSGTVQGLLGFVRCLPRAPRS